jgi:hypothetical protein
MLSFALAALSTWTWWIEPCTKPAETGCLENDSDLAAWALSAWSRASEGKLVFRQVTDENAAQLRFYWAGNRGGLYGEARPIEVNGKRGAAIYLRPTVTSAKDPLLRETIVYLTCLHESGHALGLGHTAKFEDIMYSFQYGGDIEEYFGRYRRKLAKRKDIRKYGGYSPDDARQLQRAMAYWNAF